MNNTDIVVKFLEGKWCHSPRHTINSDGTSLWSYDWWEMARWVNGEVVVRTGKRYSPTTGKQMGLLVSEVQNTWFRLGDGAVFNATKETPSDQARMNV